MAGTDFSHLTNDELIKGIKALDLPDYIRSKAYGIDVRETLAQMTEMTIQLGVNMGLSPDDALVWARKLQETVSQSEFDSWVATLLDGGPSIFMNTLSELQSTYPNGAAGVALVRETDPAKIYVWNGSAWEDFGDYQGIEIKDGSVTSEKLSNKSVTDSKLADNYQRKGQIETGSLNVVTKTGSYLVLGGTTSTVTEKPKDIKNGNLLVYNTFGGWISQIINDIEDPKKLYFRTLYEHPTTGAISNVKDWVNIGSKNTTISSGDLNDLTNSGAYLILGGSSRTVANVPNDIKNGNLIVNNSDQGWITQIITDIDDANKVYLRNFRFYNDAITNMTGWNSQISKPLSEKTIVNFGDSIFGNTQGELSVSNAIAKRTGATVINSGFGGSRISEHREGWDAFSLYRLADEIVKDESDVTKWELQEAALALNVSGMPSYYRNHLDTLKSIDFNEVEYITIAGGTNDFTARVPLDNPDDKYDVVSFAGSMRYSLEKIMTKYQHIKILLCTPIYRFWIDTSGNFIEDSDTRVYDNTLPEFVEQTKMVAKEYHVPYVDNYYGLGINKFNKELYFDGDDTTHPNYIGNDKLGSRIGNYLINEF